MNPLFGGINPQQMMMNMVLQRNPQLNQMWQNFQQNPNQFAGQINQIKQSLMTGQPVNGRAFDRNQFTQMARQMGASDNDINNFLNSLNK